MPLGRERRSSSPRAALSPPSDSPGSIFEVSNELRDDTWRAGIGFLVGWQSSKFLKIRFTLFFHHVKSSQLFVFLFLLISKTDPKNSILSRKG